MNLTLRGKLGPSPWSFYVRDEIRFTLPGGIFSIIHDHGVANAGGSTRGEEKNYTNLL